MIINSSLHDNCSVMIRAGVDVWMLEEKHSQKESSTWNPSNKASRKWLIWLMSLRMGA